MMASRTVASAFEASVRRHPSRPALIVDGGTISYAMLHELTGRLANGLVSVGARSDGGIAVVSENRLEHALIFVAGARAGIPVTSVNWRLSPEEIADSIGHLQPDIVAVSRRFLDHGDGWLAPFADDGRAFLVDDRDGSRTALRGLWKALIESSQPRLIGPGPEPEDIVSIVLTSGSTGSPKAAAISQRALVARATVMAAELRMSDSETFIAWSPLSHMVSSDYLLIQLVLGGSVAIVDGFDSHRIGECLRHFRVGWLPVMPGSYGPLLEDIREHGPPLSLRVVGSMADLVDRRLIAEVTTTMNAQFFNSFGSTEAGTLPAPATLIPIGEAPETLRKQQSAFCDVRLVDEDGSEVDAETPGEMLLRGPTLFSGYWRNPEATLADMTEDGWFRTGDIMVHHDDGTLDFVDRRKYMIKSGGESIFPTEIERVLLAHDAVIEASVVRASDERWGETPVAFVALRPGASVDEQHLVDFCVEHLARYKRPRRIVFVGVDDFPRNVTGKIIRREMEGRASLVAAGNAISGDGHGMQP